MPQEKTGVSFVWQSVLATPGADPASSDGAAIAPVHPMAIVQRMSKHWEASFIGRFSLRSTLYWSWAARRSRSCHSRASTSLPVSKLNATKIAEHEVVDQAADCHREIAALQRFTGSSPLRRRAVSSRLTPHRRHGPDQSERRSRDEADGQHRHERCAVPLRSSTNEQVEHHSQRKRQRQPYPPLDHVLSAPK